MRVNSLPPEIRTQAENSYRTFKIDPTHKGLDFKKLAGTKDLYSVRIGTLSGLGTNEPKNGS